MRYIGDLALERLVNEALAGISGPRTKAVESDQAIDLLQLRPDGNWHVVRTIYKFDAGRGCGMVAWKKVQS